MNYISALKNSFINSVLSWIVGIVKQLVIEGERESCVKHEYKKFTFRKLTTLKSGLNSRNKIREDKLNAVISGEKTYSISSTPTLPFSGSCVLSEKSRPEWKVLTQALPWEESEKKVRHLYLWICFFSLYLALILCFVYWLFSPG